MIKGEIENLILLCHVMKWEMDPSLEEAVSLS